MGIEIERKFLVRSDAYKQQAITKTFYRQGYLKSTGKGVVRVRIAGDKAYITIKGTNKGISRVEFEYEIPLVEAEQLLMLCEHYVVEKCRYKIEAGCGLLWEVDEFVNANQGLVIAEIELQHEAQIFAYPNWLGKEVTDDVRYYNANLSEHPYTQW